MKRSANGSQDASLAVLLAEVRRRARSSPAMADKLSTTPEWFAQLTPDQRRYGKQLLDDLRREAHLARLDALADPEVLDLFLAVKTRCSGAEAETVLRHLSVDPPWLGELPGPERHFAQALLGRLRSLAIKWAGRTPGSNDPTAVERTSKSYRGPGDGALEADEGVAKIGQLPGPHRSTRRR